MDLGKILLAIPFGLGLLVFIPINNAVMDMLVPVIDASTNVAFPGLVKLGISSFTFIIVIGFIVYLYRAVFEQRPQYQQM